ncbi:hypothetical protein MNV49_006288 [Pseudohyphozyma bogoriensis]|nr:hypothetical protein MNV49_006288 [Pseudohyphozyma bogoriensis]
MALVSTQTTTAPMSYDHAKSTPQIRALPTPPTRKPVPSLTSYPSSSSAPTTANAPVSHPAPVRQSTAPAFLDSDSSTPSSSRNSPAPTPSPQPPAPSHQISASASLPRLPMPSANPYNTIPQFPHPHYPFIPSPHPQQANQFGQQGMGPGGYMDQQRLLSLNLQQAQANFQQQQWQWSQQQAMFQQQNASTRRRAASGPAPPNQPFYSPQSPLPPLTHTHSHSQSYGGISGVGPYPTPSFPPGAMHPHAIAGPHGYFTPPGSDQGRDSSSTSRESSTGRGAEGYHPYRREKESIRALPQQHQGQNPAALTMQNFPPLPTSGHASSASVSRKNSPSPHPPASGSSTTRAVSHERPRTDSGQSRRSASSSIAPPPPLPGASRERKDSGSSSIASSSSHSHSHSQHQRMRSATPSTLGKVPSPLSRASGSFETERGRSSFDSRPGTPGTLKGRGDGEIDGGEESDDTAEATFGDAVKSGKGKEKVVEKDEKKEKKGVGMKLKKAFNLAPPELEINGRGASHASTARGRGRRDSTSSDESSPAPQTPPPPAAASSRPPPSGRRSIFNGKLNSSTDNISISSTVSSASVMIRKLGQMGKLARRNSLMGLTKAFKKDKKEGEEGGEGSSSGGGVFGKKDKKKGAAATANVSHVTAEVESTATSGMSPAAALAKKQQLHYAEQEAAEAAAAAAAAAAALEAPPVGRFGHGRTDSGASAASETGSIRSGRGWGRSKTTDDVVEGGAAKTKMLEKEKEKLKSRKGRKWGFGGSKDKERDEKAGEGEPDLEDEEDQATPRGSMEILHPPTASALPYSSYGRSGYYEDGETESPPAEEEYEPSFSGVLPVSGHRRDAKAAKGILKGAGTYNQEDFSARPPFRNRANSFDAPAQQGRPGSPGNAALVGKIPSEAQVDGLAHPPSTSLRTDTQPPSPPSPTPSASAVYTNPAHNASAPALAHVGLGGVQPIRAQSTPGGFGRRIAFAPNLSVHTTWPGTVYDRRAEPATCNRLTPALAQRIKEELNAFKMEEMEVHPTSRQLTHFFV